MLVWFGDETSALFSLLLVAVHSYDALLAAGNSWEELCLRAVLHGGDNDSTGAIACAWFGALYGFTGVPRCNYEVCCKPLILKLILVLLLGSVMVRTRGLVIGGDGLESHPLRSVRCGVRPLTSRSLTHASLNYQTL